MTSYDPFGAETLEDPFPAYAELRQAALSIISADFQPPFSR